MHVLSALKKANRATQAAKLLHRLAAKETVTPLIVTIQHFGIIKGVADSFERTGELFAL